MSNHSAPSLITSPLLLTIEGLAHGFGRRIPGPRAAARNAAQATFERAGDVFFLRQVHGCAVATPPWAEPPEADASYTDRAGALLAIETADCLPILIVDPVHRRVAAAHAGWRGTVARVAQAAVRALVAAGSEPRQLVASLGPAIGPCCYEVGRDVEEAFGESGSRFFVPGPREKKCVDVAAANRAQLEEVGLLGTNIDRVDLCTRCREDLFFSYRRDGANAGRMISVVGFSRPD
jgi:YfiH family protein